MATHKRGWRRQSTSQIAIGANLIVGRCRPEPAGRRPVLKKLILVLTVASLSILSSCAVGDTDGSVDDGVSTSTTISRTTLRSTPTPTPTFDAYREDAGLVAYLAERDGRTVEEARSLARWESTAVQAAEAIYAEFGKSVVNTEIDHDRRALLFYVSSSEEQIDEFASAYAPYVGTIEVLGGYLPVTEVQEWWYRIESALVEGRVSFAGAGIGPNEITIHTSDPHATQRVVDGLDLPDSIAVEFETLEESPPKVAVWEVFPDFEVDEQTLRIPIQVTELECSGGESPRGRILPPEVEYSPTRVTITVRVAPKTGFQDCPGNPPATLLIHLSEPVGDRTLVDGGSQAR